MSSSNRGYQTLRVQTDGGVATIAIHRPDRKNAIGPLTINELLYAFEDSRDDASTRVVVLTGTGAVFSAGGDLGHMASGTGPALPPKGGFPELLLAFGDLGKPTIAAIPGPAMGGALGLIAACDFALATESATFGTPEIKRGLFPMMIMAPIMRVVPRRELLSMMLLGEVFPATEAARIGLINRVVPDGTLDAEVGKLAARLCTQSPTALRMGLRAFHHQQDQALAEALPYLQEQLFAILGTEDANEGLKAFMEKRQPIWTGR